MSEVNGVGGEGAMNNTIIRRKKRKSGEGCFKDEAKKRRSQGLSYEGNKGNTVAAKQTTS